MTLLVLTDLPRDLSVVKHSNSLKVNSNVVHGELNYDLRLALFSKHALTLWESGGASSAFPTSES